MNSRHIKLVDRFCALPKDFRWNELVRLLDGFGYRQAKGGKTGGSRVRFVSDEGLAIFIHRPHPGSIIKPNTMRDIYRQLQERGYI